MTDNDTWMMNLNSPCLFHVFTKQISHLGGCFCAFEILIALATKQDLVAVVYTGSLIYRKWTYFKNRWWAHNFNLFNLHILFTCVTWLNGKNHNSYNFSKPLRVSLHDGERVCLCVGCPDVCNFVGDFRNLTPSAIRWVGSLFHVPNGFAYHVRRWWTLKCFY